MSDLVAFLEARIAEDQRTIQENRCVNCGNRTKVDQNDRGPHMTYTHDRWNPETERFSGWEGVRCPGRVTGAERHPLPERALAEITAKREILRHLAQLRNDGESAVMALTDDVPLEVSAAVSFGMIGAPGVIEKLLAAPYSGHPDYDPAWKIEERC